MEHSLIISLDNQTVFTSDQHWLYPLFEFEDYLKRSGASADCLFLKDKIAGKAAACMIVFLGIKHCHIELLSERAIPVFKGNGIEYTYDRLVEHIQCRTEDLISDSMSISDAYLFLRKRAGRVKGLSLKMTDVSVSLGGNAILNQLNLDVGRGEQVIIHGANGVGKTTLLRSILGLIIPETGKIEIGDYLVGSEEWKKNRSIIGYVHQENIKNNFPISAGEEIGRASCRERV